MTSLLSGTCDSPARALNSTKIYIKLGRRPTTMSTAETQLSTNRPSSVGEGLSALYTHRELLYQFARRNLLVSSRGTILGIGWLVIMPLLLMLMYSFVFGVIFGGRYGVIPSETGPEYALGIFLSLSIFQLFAEPMGSSPRLISSNPTLVKKVVFPLEILPCAHVAAQIVRFLVSASLVAIGALVFGKGILLTWVWFPLCIAPLIFLSLGVAYLFSSIGVFVRDLGELTRVLTTVFLFGSGVFFSMQRVPESMRWILELNPLVHLLEQSRATFLWGMPPDLTSLSYASAVSLVVFFLGLFSFQRLRDDFADAI